MMVVRSLKCLAVTLLLSFVAVGSAAAMTFQPTYVDGRPGIVAIGEITLDTPAEFAAAAPAPGTLVYLNSPGGNVGAAVQLGSLFRSRAITAVVAGVTEDGVAVPGCLLFRLRLCPGRCRPPRRAGP